MSAHKPDRYISFDGIDCMGNAQRLMQILTESLEALDPTNPWYGYMQQKLQQMQKLQQDDLMFIGGQLNALREYFEQQLNGPALSLLHQIEVECC